MKKTGVFTTTFYATMMLKTKRGRMGEARKAYWQEVQSLLHMKQHSKVARLTGIAIG